MLNDDDQHHRHHHGEGGNKRSGKAIGNEYLILCFAPPHLIATNYYIAAFNCWDCDGRNIKKSGRPAAYQAPVEVHAFHRIKIKSFRCDFIRMP